MDIGAEGFPAEPGGDSEAEGVDEVVVFQAVFDDPPGVEDGMFAFVGPTFGKLDEATREVGGSPDGEAPEEGLGESGPFVDEGDEAEEDEEEGDVKAEEFPILLGDGCTDGRDQIQGDHEEDGAGDPGFAFHQGRRLRRGEREGEAELFGDFSEPGERV